MNYLKRRNVITGMSLEYLNLLKTNCALKYAFYLVGEFGLKKCTYIMRTEKTRP